MPNFKPTASLAQVSPLNPADNAVFADKSEMISVSRLIAHLGEIGLRIGRTGSDSYNTLRYYTKIGLLPHMNRMYSAADDSIVGHYPVSVIERLRLIEHLKKKGLSNEQVFLFLKKRDQQQLVDNVAQSTTKNSATNAPVSRAILDKQSVPPSHGRHRAVTLLLTAIIILLLVGLGSVFAAGMNPVLRDQVAKSIEGYRQNFAENFLNNFSPDLARLVWPESNLAAGDSGNVLASETRFPSDGSSNYINYNGAAVFRDPHYATLRLENYAWRDTDGTLYGPDFLVAQQQGSGVFYLQAGGNVYSEGNFNFFDGNIRRNLLVQNNFTVEQQSRLADLLVRGTLEVGDASTDNVTIQSAIWNFLNNSTITGNAGANTLTLEEFNQIWFKDPTTITERLTLTGKPTSANTSGGLVYLNPTTPTGNDTIIGMEALAGGTDFRVDAEGDIYARSLHLTQQGSGNLLSINNSTRDILVIEPSGKTTVTDGTNTVRLAGATYAISATGEMILTGKLTFAGTTVGSSAITDAMIYYDASGQVQTNIVFGVKTNKTDVGDNNFYVDAQGNIYGHNLNLTGISSTGASLLIQDDLVVGTSSGPDGWGNDIEFNLGTGRLAIRYDNGVNNIIQVNALDDSLTLGNTGAGDTTLTGPNLIVSTTGGLSQTVDGNANETYTGTLDQTVGSTATYTYGSTATVNLADNLSNALRIRQGTGSIDYLVVNTDDLTESVQFGNTTTNPSYIFRGIGNFSVASAGTVSFAPATLFNLSTTNATLATINIGTSSLANVINIGSSAASDISLTSASRLLLTAPYTRVMDGTYTATLVDAEAAKLQDGTSTIYLANGGYIMRAQTDVGTIDRFTVDSTGNVNIGSDDNQAYAYIHSGGTLRVYDASDDRYMEISVTDNGASNVSTSAGDLTLTPATNKINTAATTINLTGGSTIFDVNSAAADTTLTIQNSGGGSHVANLSVQGDVMILGNKLTFGDGETIDVETSDILKLTSGGDVRIVLGDAVGAKKFQVYDSTGTNELAYINSDGKYYVTDGVRYLQTTDGTRALLASDSVNTVELATGTYAIDATGNIRINGNLAVNGTSKLGDGGTSNYAMFNASGNLAFYGLGNSITGPAGGALAINSYAGQQLTLGSNTQLNLQSPIIATNQASTLSLGGKLTVTGALTDIGGGTYTLVSGANDLGLAGNLEVIGSSRLANDVTIGSLANPTLFIGAAGSARGFAFQDTSFANLLSNASFETDGDGGGLADQWTNSGLSVTSQSATADYGAYSQLATADGVADHLYQSVSEYNNYQGKYITASVWVRHNGVAETAQLEVYDGVSTASSTVVTSASWQRIYVTNLVSASATELTFRLYPAMDGVGTSLFDGAMLQEGRIVSQFALRGGDFSSIGSDLLPAVDNTYDLGSAALRWQDLHLGPTSLKIYSTTGTLGAGSDYTLGQLTFSGTNLKLATSAVGSGGVGSIQLTTGANIGLNIDSSGQVGIGITNPASALDVAAGNITLQNREVIDNSVNGTVTLTGAGGANNTALSINLDNAGGPILSATSAINMAIGGVNKTTLSSTSLYPSTAEGLALGSTTNEFDALYLGDNDGAYFGLAQNWNLAFDAAGDNRLELTSSTAGQAFAILVNSQLAASFSDIQNTFNVPTVFSSSGDTQFAYDITLSNPTAAYINFSGPGYIRTNSPSGNYDLTLSAANSGQIVLSDSVLSAGNNLPTIDNTYNLGSGLSRWANVYATNLIGAITPTGFTQGSVVFAGSGGTLSQNNANFYWDNATARLGIGTTAPGTKLHVDGGAVTNIATFESDSGQIFINGSSGINEIVSRNSDNSSFQNIELRAGAAGTGVYVKTAGNVGIGTTNPAVALEIGGSGNVRIGGLTASSGVYTDSSKNLISTPPTSGTLGYWARTGTALSPSNAGDDIALPTGDWIGLSYSTARLVFTDTTRDNLTVTDGDLLFSADNTWDIGASGATRPRTGYFGTSLVVGSTITLSTADINFSGNSTLTLGGDLKVGTNALYVSGTSGNVGVGTTNPTGKLHVLGECIVKGSLVRRRKKKRNGEDDDDEFDYEDIPVEDIQAGDEVLSLNETTGKFEWQKVEKTMDKGMQTVYELKTETGKAIETTANHPYYIQKLGKPKVGVFIDDSNLFFASKSAGWRVDFNKLVKLIASTYDIEFAHYHAAIPDKSDFVYTGAIEYLSKLSVNIQVVQKPLKYIKTLSGITKKGDIDVELVLDVVRSIDSLDMAIVVSGDSDYLELAKYVEQDKGKQIAFIGYKRNMAWELRLKQHLFVEKIKNFVELGVKKNPKYDLGAIMLGKLYKDNNNLSSSNGTWTKVSEIHVGQSIATVGGFEKVVSIKKTGRKQTYDLQIANTHTFVANGIVAHNTYLQGTSTANTAFSLRTADSAGVDKFVVTNAGNVGIGTTAPKLHLNVVGAAGAPANSGTTATGIARFDEGALGLSIDFGVIHSPPYPAWIQVHDNTDQSQNYPLVLNPNGGNVGIGTTVPVSRLHVSDGNTPVSAFYGSSDRFVVSSQAEATGASVVTAGDVVAQRPVFKGVRSRGTLASPTAVQNNDYLMSFLAAGYDGSAGQAPAAVDFYVDGTVSAGSVPARISFTTGTNGTDRLERLTIKSSGNVGIGTTGPADKVHIAGSSATDFRALTLRNSDGTTGSAAVLGFEASTGTLGDDASLAAQIKGVRLGSGTNGALEFWTANLGVPARAVRIDNNGNVGIGTTAPGSKLGVAGALTVGSTYANLAGPSNGLAIEGNVGIGTTNPGYKLDVNGIIFSQDMTYGVWSYVLTSGYGPDRGIFNWGNDSTPSRFIRNRVDAVATLVVNQANAESTGDILDLQASGVTKVAFLQSGNVGIGTTGPGSKVHIVAGADTGAFGTAASVGDGLIIEAKHAGTGRTPAYINFWGKDAGTSGDGTEGTARIVSSFMGSGAWNASGLTIQTHANDTAAWTDDFTIKAGNVGIGTTGPGYKLDVTGDFRTTSSAWLGSGLTGQGLFVATDGNVGIGTTAPGGKLDVSGKIVIGKTGLADAGTTGKSSYDLILRASAWNGSAEISKDWIIRNSSSQYLYENLAFIRPDGTTVAYFEGGSGGRFIMPSYGANINSTYIGWGTAGTIGGTTYGDVITFNANAIVQGAFASTIPLIVKGKSSQTANLFQWQDSSGTGLGGIDNNGNVGIGDVAPGTKLSVVGNAQIGYASGTLGPANGLAISGNVGIGTTGPLSKLDVNGGVAIGSYAGATAAPANGLIVSGDMGLGTISPTHTANYTTLSIGGTTGGQLIFQNGTIYKGYIYNNATDMLIGANNNFIYTTGVDSTERMRISATGGLSVGTATWNGTDPGSGNVAIQGNVGIGTTSPSALLHLGIGSTAVVGQKIVLASGATANAFEVNTSTGVGGNLVVMQSNGNVGIGTTGPAYKLQVVGGSIASGILNSADTANIGGLKLYSSTDVAGRRNWAINPESTYQGQLGIWVSTSNSTEASAGTQVVSIKSNGNVGIGTTGPGSRLHVSDSVGTSNTASITIDEASGGATELVMKAGVAGTGRRNAIRFIQKDISTTTPRWLIGSGLDQTAGDDKFQFQNAAGTPSVTFLQNGNVGIGTTGPADKVHIAGSSATDFRALTLRNSDGTTGSAAVLGFEASTGTLGDDASLAAQIKGVRLGSGTNGALEFWTANLGVPARAVRIDNNGNVGIGTTGPGNLLSINNSGYTVADKGLEVTEAGVSKAYLGVYASEGGLKLWSSIAPATTPRVFLSAYYNSYINPAGGNVGIGTTLPSNKLDVQVPRSATQVTPLSIAVGDTAYATNDEVSVDFKYNYNNHAMGRISGYIQNEPTYDGGLKFYTAPLGVISTTPAVTMDKAGNVGIGTTSPSALFHLGIGSTAVVGQKIVLASGATANAFEVNTSTGVGGNLVVMQSNGNVGIGTTGPGNLLHVKGGKIVSEGTSGGWGLAQFVNTNVGEATIVQAAGVTGGIGGTLTSSSNNYIWAFGPGSYGTTPDKFNIGSNGITGNVALSVSAPSGNVGIGTTGPSQKLDVAGSINLTGGIAGGTTYSGSGNITSSAGVLTISGTGNSSIAGNVGIGTTSPNEKLVVQDSSDPTLKITDGVRTLLLVGDTGSSSNFIGTGTANSLQIGTNNTNAIQISTDQKVGIGWTTASKLGVLGNFAVGSDYTGVAAPANGAVIQGNVGIGYNNPGTATLAINGNVGIGTTGPGANVDILGSNTLIDTRGNLYVRTNTTQAVDVGGQIALGGYTNGTTADVVFGSILGKKENSTAGNYAGYLAFSSTPNAGAVTERMRITSTGNVGIGTTAPATSLHIAGASTANRGQLALESTSGSTLFSLYSGTTYKGWMQYDNTSNYLELQNYNNGSYGPIVLQRSGGNVGIGTTGPGYKLDVTGDFRTTSSAWLGSGLTGQGLFVATDGNVGIGTTAPKEKLDLGGALGTTGGNIILGTANATVSRYLGVGIGTSGAFAANDGFSGLEFGPPLGTGEGYVAIHTHDAGVDSGEKMRIDKRGNVGIGTTVPGRKLQVVDTANDVQAKFGDGSRDTALEMTSSAGTAELVRYTSGNYFNFWGGKMYLDSGGKLGIGQILPGSALSVNGGISAGSYSGTAAPSNGMIISGNVGIGTTGPVSKLDVAGTIRGTGETVPTSGTGLEMGYISGSAFGFLVAYDRTGTAYKQIRINDLVNVGLGSSGNVGIGTTGPGYTLDVNGTINIPVNIPIRASGALILSTGSSNDTILRSYNRDILFQDPAGSDLVAIKQSGNVGIGTTGPGAKLEVSGAAEGIRITGAGTTGASSLAYLSFYDSNGSTQRGYIGDGSSGNTDMYVYAASGNKLRLYGGGVEGLVVDTSGNVGIGTTAPSSRLTTNTQSPSANQLLFNVQNTGSNVFSVDAEGDYFFDGTGSSPAADVAEVYPADETGIMSGEIVSLKSIVDNPESTVGKSVIVYDPDLLGVVTTKPALLMGSDVPNGVAVALVGRVPVKVNNQNGTIQKGDYITSSTTPGEGMKATQAGMVVGRAVSDVSCQESNNLGISNSDLGIGGSVTSECTVTVFTNLSWYDPTHTASLALTSTPIDTAKYKDLTTDKLMVNQTLSVLGATSLTNATVTGSLNVGLLAIEDSSINVAGGVLKLQNAYGSGNIEAFGGKIVMTADGSIKVLASVTAQKYNVDNSNVAAASAGKVVVKAGTKEIEITTTALTSNSLVFVTAKNSISQFTYKVTSVNKITIYTPVNVDVDTTVNWWIIN